MKVLGSKFGFCRLCLAQAKLCESHIVPEFCYEYEISGNKRKAFSLSEQTNGPVQKHIIQKGYREYLLRSGCEQVLCKHEQKFSALWKDCILSKPSFQIGKPVEIHGADYHSIKLFLLSVFWRASVSARFGEEMELGPYSEKLRQILYENKHVKQNQYPLMGILILDDSGRPFHGCVTSPVAMRLDQAWAYAMHFAGCEWRIIMSDHGVPKKLEPIQYVVAENGSIFLITQHHSQDRFLHHMASRLKAQGG